MDGEAAHGRRPDDWVDAAAEWAGAYVHIPFCARICPYCDFAVVEGHDSSVGPYFEALATEIRSEPAWRPLDAVFVGGGTPSHVSPQRLASLVGDLRSRFGLAADPEITLEANPEDWTPERAAALIAAGFTRVSFGVQSFDRQVLTALGRRHDPEQAIAAVAIARTEGFGSVSIDLIMGTPGESLASWRSTVETAAGLSPDHVSAYTLTVEQGTELWRQIEGGSPAPDPDDQADKYELARRLLPASGLLPYEVSNYAKPGHECRYNLIAWAQGEYLAFGMGAHGHRDGRRTWRPRRLDTYLDRCGSATPVLQGEEVLTGDDRQRERLMLGLRRSAGVVAGEVGESWLEGAEAMAFLDAGVVASRGGRIIVERPLLSDAVARSILGG